MRQLDSLFMNVCNSMDESLYGMRKRLKFILSVISKYSKDTTILDVGCGTGEFISFPLASVGYKIVAIDTDHASIDLAKKNNKYPNCIFKLAQASSVEGNFGIIILSEVLEHVPDPLPFLLNVAGKLSPDGVLIITVPNGRGPFEIEMKLWRKEFLFKPMKAVGKILRLLRDSAPISGICSERKDSLNTVSPHINFFKLREVAAIFEQADLRIISFKKRTVFCGPYSSIMFNYNKTFHRLNSLLADVLPASLASDWMFALKKKKSSAKT